MAMAETDLASDEGTMVSSRAPTTIGYRRLIEKLAHPLESVRLPALRSLLFKLQQHLISLDDVVQVRSGSKDRPCTNQASFIVGR